MNFSTKDEELAAKELITITLDKVKIEKDQDIDLVRFSSFFLPKSEKELFSPKDLFSLNRCPTKASVTKLSNQIFDQIDTDKKGSITKSKFRRFLYTIMG